MAVHIVVFVVTQLEIVCGSLDDGGRVDAGKWAILVWVKS